jgi:hypothetical protein
MAAIRNLAGKPLCRRLARQSLSLRRIFPDSPDLQSFHFRWIHVSPPTGGRYTMEFKTNAALTEWANDQTMPEIAAYYNGLPGVKPVKKFESRDVVV